MVETVRKIKILRNTANGIAVVHDPSTGLNISIHPSIDRTGSTAGMKAKGYWRESDRTVACFGAIFNIDKMSFDASDPLYLLALRECRREACVERRRREACIERRQIGGAV